MTNLPDDYNHAAFVSAYEGEPLDISDETHTVAAVYYLSEWLGIPTDEAALHDFTWESVYENGTSESREDAAYEEISKDLKQAYKDKPANCLRVLGLIVADKEKR